MLLSHLLSAVVLAAGSPDPAADGLSMRVPVSGLNLGDRTDAAVFAGRIADQSRRFCEAHRYVVTPTHVGDPAVCERAMGALAVSALPDREWRRFVRAGGKTALNRRLG